MLPAKFRFDFLKQRPCLERVIDSILILEQDENEFEKEIGLNRMFRNGLKREIKSP